MSKPEKKKSVADNMCSSTVYCHHVVDHIFTCIWFFFSNLNAMSSLLERAIRANYLTFVVVLHMPLPICGEYTYYISKKKIIAVLKVVVYSGMKSVALQGDILDGSWQRIGNYRRSIVRKSSSVSETKN